MQVCKHWHILLKCTMWTKIIYKVVNRNFLLKQVWGKLFVNSELKIYNISVLQNLFDVFKVLFAADIQNLDDDDSTSNNNRHNEKFTY